jgi:hypothetical protein
MRELDLSYDVIKDEREISISASLRVNLTLSSISRAKD